MIALQITGCCEDCEYIALKMDYFTAGEHKYYAVQCEHANVCYRLENEARRRAAGENLARKARDPEWQAEHERILCGGGG